MDRAHRLGQRKVVNVHRLIMRGTLEEKIMSLQRFKVSVANAVINADNASLKTMNTDQLLDLFSSAETGRKVVILTDDMHPIEYEFSYSKIKACYARLLMLSMSLLRIFGCWTLCACVAENCMINLQMFFLTHYFLFVIFRIRWK